MSAVKFQCPPYKLYEPDYHPQKPIIVGVDDRLESPETVTLRYEEAARVASGGDPAGDSPPRLLEMATYGKAQLPSMPGYDASRYQDNAYEQYPAQSFPQQSVDKFAQLNQQSFAANNAAVAQYMPPSVSVLSCQPTSGSAGNKIYLKISSAYDLFPISSPMPYVNLIFGSEKCAVQDVARDAQDGQGYFYSCNVEVPQLLVTGCTGSSVPLALLIEGPSGEEISRTSAGSFQYVDGSADDITRTAKITKHETAPPGTQVDQASPSTKAEEPQLPSDATTNTYDYPSQPAQYAQQYQGNNDMLTAYRTTSFTEPGFHRRPGPVWNGFSGPLGSTGRSPALDHTLTGRSSLTPLPMPSSTSSGTPQLVRTSIAQNAGGYASGYFPSKASLKLNGKLDSMTENWTQEEWSERRRLVVFRKSQSGSTLHASFRPVSPSERPQGSTCVSCIWWAEKRECYVTSVDTIYLLEQLVAAPNKFTVEEKNRIRRNLEGYHPLTVSKAKADSEDFFKLIMAFPHPKPRNIEKDVKVFPWKVLESALKKIIGKYCASPSSLVPSSNSMHPQPHHPPSAGGYAPLPTPPAVQTLGSQHGDPHGPYGLHTAHHDNIPSPRSLPGSQGAWAPYTTAPSYPAAPRPSSPNARYSSPQQPPLRLTTAPLPAVTSYDTRTVTTAGYGNSGLHTPVSHHPSTATPPRWDPTPTNYSEGYSALPGQHATSTQPVYSASGYADGPQRA